ncbi:MAG: alcohol dehydrogenase catalytic domain-containing protein [Chloroflexi bacterium]|nr:alcohol dehydrogenase catalytic domain-containing protein [Chloroflexota bacterium]
MQALIYTGPDRLEVQDVATPEPGDGEVLVRVHYVGICGTDLHLWQGEMKAALVPVIVGHEVVGEVVQDRSGRFAPGDRVAIEPLLVCGECRACRGGFSHVCRNLKVQGVHANGGAAEYMVTPSHRLHALPDSLSWETAALTEPTSVAVHMNRRAGIQLGDVVLVLGGGPIGLLVASVARAAGAGRVLVSEVSPTRLDLCMSVGLETIDARASDPVEVIRGLTNGEGADVVVEAVGHPATAAQMTEAARPHGTILIGGIGAGAVPTDLPAVVFKELTFVGSRVYESRDMDTAIHLLASGAVKVDGLITRMVPLAAAVADGYERLRSSRDEMKILLAP